MPEYLRNVRDVHDVLLKTRCLRHILVRASVWARHASLLADFEPSSDIGRFPPPTVLPRVVIRKVLKLSTASASDVRVDANAIFTIVSMRRRDHLRPELSRSSVVLVPYNTRSTPDIRAIPLCENFDPMAAEYLQRVLSLQRENGDVWSALGHCFLMQDNLQNAYFAYQQALYYLPNPKPFCGLRSFNSSRTRNFGTALAFFTTAILHLNNDDYSSTPWCSIGILYYNINQFLDALDAYSRAIRINAYISEVWFDLGSLYESRNNQILDAINAYARAAELDPGNPHITQRLNLLRNAQANGGTLPAAPGPQDIHPTAYAGNGPFNPMHAGTSSVGPPPPLTGGAAGAIGPAPGQSRPPQPDSRGPDGMPGPVRKLPTLALNAPNATPLALCDPNASPAFLLADNIVTVACALAALLSDPDTPVDTPPTLVTPAQYREIITLVRPLTRFKDVDKELQAMLNVFEEQFMTGLQQAASGVRDVRRRLRLVIADWDAVDPNTRGPEPAGVREAQEAVVTANAILDAIAHGFDVPPGDILYAKLAILIIDRAGALGYKELSGRNTDATLQ
ncbi:Lysine-specific demethylase 6A, partial [Ceratobasidium sp. 395]